MPFEYTADFFPQELILYFKARFSHKQPRASVTLTTPDGREVRIGDFSVDHTQTFIFSQDTRLTRRLGNMPPREGIFLNPDADSGKPIKGQYTLNIKVLTFEKDADIDTEFVVYGQVAGWAGTDAQRRDIGLALLWGTPFALSFGLLAALGTTITTMLIAAVGVWYGGWLDNLIQRVTEVNLVAMVPRFSLGPHSQVMEVASNDGYLLQFFVERGIPSLGIEPAANVAAEAERKGVPTLVRFFGRGLAEELVRENRRADLLAANNVLAHVPDLNDFVAGLRTVLKPEGVATLEFPHLLRLIEGSQYDTIYHEHFS